MTRGIVVGTLIVMAAALASRSAGAEEDPGRAAYLKYCSACHGPEGKGDGVVASVLRPPPTNLTLLAKQQGGTFPYQLVKESIDGRKPSAAHGDSAMPVWGQVFSDDSALTHSAPAEVRGKVQLIADYVARIQAR